MIASLEKPAESNGFQEIINFLNANQIHYALTVNHTIYTSCIEQFWAIAKAKMINGERQLQVLVDKKKVIIMESSIRSDLHLEDACGNDCLPTTTIFEELARMGRKQRKETEVPQDVTHHDDSVPIPSNDPLLSGEDKMQLIELMILCTNLQKQVLDLKKANDAQTNEIASLKKKVQKLEKEKEIKNYRVKKIKEREVFEDIDKDAEVILDMEVGEKQEQSVKVDEREVSTGVEDSVAPTIPVTTAATTTTTTRPKARGVVVQEPTEFRTTKSSP
ncbi:hypothetical protein Tco_0838315 [Tanacetum coccineum]|uniref:Xylulose kinase-1 n=1 Tax=Tanacetum coccineum TaxID=301880 RepID=A0ABQ5ARH1_9ASTR